MPNIEELKQWRDENIEAAKVEGQEWSAEAVDLLTWAIAQIEQKWISVDEKMPQDYQSVLVCTNNRIVIEGYYDGSDWHEINETYFTLKPTHWMPLPQPPSLK